jgi:hypothetical protein
MWVKVATSWFALLVVAAVAVKVYNPDLFSKFARPLAGHASPPAAAPEASTRKQKTKRPASHRHDLSGKEASTPTLSASEGKANKKRKIISPPVENKVVAQTAEGQQVTLPRDEDDGMSNKEFAQQLAKAQAGTKLEGAKTQGPSKKERRAAAHLSKAASNGGEAAEHSTETSSATGPDGDDDFSAAGSPSTGPVSTAPTSRAGDVSDMLEAPASKPGVLRLTDIKDSGSKAVPKQSQAFQPALTKKQRQRQAKAAEQKILREEADRLQEQKKQAHLRTARMAEGSSNQTKANAFAAKQNAWQSNKPAAEKLATSSSSNEVPPLLDTFEKPEVKVASTNGAVSSEPLSNVTNAVPDTAHVSDLRREVGERKTSALGASEREAASRPALSSKASWADEVNEEDQNKWVNELAEEEKWESVTSKKGKKKSRRDTGETSSEASSSLARPITNGKPTINGSQPSGVKKPGAENLNRYQSIEVSGDSSFKDAEWEA